MIFISSKVCKNNFKFFLDFYKPLIFLLFEKKKKKKTLLLIYI
jgi:hypothetical protein